MDQVTWRKAWRSNDQEGACVEVAMFPDAIGMRNSKDPDRPHLLLTAGAFRALLTELKHW
ncbi:DUF397 domain-containing protein [Actinomadura sp. NAK00032]|uniref:DUF397 domain-containing protein n=1 Tax=Actinomadura sp. NAK00032 TaxID=2742128 RepID=UPI001591B613|nr:DUF397 domain-containing protein [Actinomadura sp. NAK00032]QKW34220.1 DUF397 domain-containing protein [Actinomadura sp. NAK00032]